MDAKKQPDNYKGSIINVGVGKNPLQHFCLKIMHL